MKVIAILTAALLALSCGTPKQYTFELNGGIVDGPSEEHTTSIDMYQDNCDPDPEVFTSALYNLSVQPILLKEPGQADVGSDLFVSLKDVKITYTARANALGNEGSVIEAITLTDVAQRDLKINTVNETQFFFLSLDQKDQWREDQGGPNGEQYLYDYKLTLTFVYDGDKEQEEELTGTFEMGNFDKCE